MTYSYPRLSSHDLGWVRLSGPGLANCMFMASRCYIDSIEYKTLFISPTWRKISIGPLLRGERDKRAYSSLFVDYGINGWKKVLLLLKWKICKKPFNTYDSINGYFMPLYGKHEIVKQYFNTITRPETLSQLANTDFSNTIAVHVRLGDYSADRRVNISWYKGVIENIKKQKPNANFALFSDGTDEEVKALTDMENVERHFYGNAFADMTAISRCRLVIASDSTFSAWGAYLGKRPIIFSRRHFPPVYGKEDNVTELVLGDSVTIPSLF